MPFGQWMPPHTAPFKNAELSGGRGYPLGEPNVRDGFQSIELLLEAGELSHPRPSLPRSR